MSRLSYNDDVTAQYWRRVCAATLSQVCQHVFKKPTNSLLQSCSNLTLPARDCLRPCIFLRATLTLQQADKQIQTIMDHRRTFIFSGNIMPKHPASIHMTGACTPWICEECVYSTENANFEDHLISEQVVTSFLRRSSPAEAVSAGSHLLLAYIRLSWQGDDGKMMVPRVFVLKMRSKVICMELHLTKRWSSLPTNAMRSPAEPCVYKPRSRTWPLPN